MKKFFIKGLSVILTLSMIITSVSMSISALADDLVFTDILTNENYLPYVGEDGKYYRYSDNVLIDFGTDYDEMVAYFQQKMCDREADISYRFATTDLNYGYVYENENSTEQRSRANAVTEKLFNSLMYDVFRMNIDGKENADRGDYLFNSIYSYSYSYSYYMSNMDTPREGCDRYFTFNIKINNIKYYSDYEQECAVKRFAEDFNREYIDCDESLTDYDKVKVIYDLVVRNASYDNKVNKKLYPQFSDRYNISRTAYGALFGASAEYDDKGNRLSDVNSETKDYKIDKKLSVINQGVINKANQGLAVCEGYSKLFYYLCIYNGIKCRMVDGDYDPSTGKSDPHQWNYVYLDDHTAEGARWFQVDTTFASQHSYKEVDYNNYNYFLCGTGNTYFGIQSHQQAYEFDNNKKEQLYNWYLEENVSSFSDYTHSAIDFTKTPLEYKDVILERETYYYDTDVPRYTFILKNDDGDFELALEETEDGDFITYTNVEGFTYNGKASKYTAMIPYVIDQAYSSNNVTVTDCGTYSIDIVGANTSSFKTTFKIVPYEMTKEHFEYFVKNKDIGYIGKEIKLDILVIDGYGNELVYGEGKDYTYQVLDMNGKKAVIEEMGTYIIKLDFYGNYVDKEDCTFKYVVGKINLENINTDDVIPFGYLPDYYKNLYKIKNPADYFCCGVRTSDSFRIGNKSLMPDRDFTVVNDADNSIDFGDSGVLTITGLDGNNSNVLGGTTTKFRYVVNKKFDIGYFDGNIADGSANYVYTGSEIKPKTLTAVDKQLVLGKDYEIVSYSNNINASQNAEVTIRGIGGCEGTAKMKFQIIPESISKASVVYSKDTGYCVVKFNGKTLKKNVDYSETKVSTSSGETFIIVGMGNFSGQTNVTVAIDHGIKPTTKNNKVTLSTTTYIYDGKAKKPTIKVTNANGKTVNSYYYTVKYSSNTNVGKAKVVISFRNGFTGSTTKYFTINPKGTTLSGVTAASKGFTAKWKKQATQTTGYEIQYSTDKNFKKGNKTVTVSKNSTTSKKVTKLKAKKKYYVRIRTYKTVSGTKYYSAWSASKTVTTKK